MLDVAPQKRITQAAFQEGMREAMVEVYRMHPDEGARAIRI